jgi:hypothetical protein
MFFIVEPSGVANLDVIILIVAGHIYSTLNSCMLFIVKSFSIVNLDVRMLIVEGHMHISLISHVFFHPHSP